MPTTNRFAQTGAVFYALWGLVHIMGAAFQLITYRSTGAEGLSAMVSSARPFSGEVPAAAGAFMVMGSMNLLWIGLLVTAIALTLNWRNHRLGFWLNLGVVGATDAALLLALLLPGIMAWSDGSIGLSLFALALVFSSMGRVRASP